MTIFAERLQILMDENRLNRSQVAKRIDVAPSTVHRWFTRGSVPNLEVTDRIARFFRVDERWLRGAIEKRSPESEKLEAHASTTKTENKKRKASLFADRLEIVMNEYGYNRNQLANRIGVSSASVTRWFTRGSIPGIDTIEKIAGLFHIDQRWLVGSIDEMRTDSHKNEINQSDSSMYDEVVRVVSTLSTTQLQRVKDFIAGLKG